MANYLPMVDVKHGSGTYQPMADGARYQVNITRTGLISRPVNEAASEAASGGWDN
jgi:hypothetical protein